MSIGVPFAIAEVTGRHTVDRFFHGIEGNQTYFRAEEELNETVPDRYCANLVLGMYHHNPNGSWNTQVYDNISCGWWHYTTYQPGATYRVRNTHGHRG